MDQSVRSWIFGALSPEVLVDACDCPTSFHLWERLNQHFMHSSMTRALELKHMLINHRKFDLHSMDGYLCEIKIAVDSRAAVNSPIPSFDLVHYNLLGLGRGYENLVTSLTHAPMCLTFDDLRPRLLGQE